MRSREVVQWGKAKIGKLLAGASLIPVIVVAVYIMHNGVNTPHWDEWDASVPIALKTAGGTLTWRDLLVQHNQTRFLFSHLLTAFLTYSMGWNTKAEMYVSLALTAACWFVLVRLFAREDSKAPPLIMLPFSLLMFSFRQRAIWQLGLETSRVLQVLFLLGALWLLMRYPVGWLPLLGAALLALGSTYAFQLGILVWPVLLMTLWMLGYRKWPYYLFWLVAAAVSLRLFFANYIFVGQGFGNTPQSLLSNNFILGRYVAAFLGAPFAAEYVNFVILAGWVGVGGAALLLANLLYLWSRDRQLRPLAVWSTLGAFALATALLTGIGRVPLMLESPAQPLSSRYVNASTLLWVAVVAVIVLSLQRLPAVSRRRWWERALAQTNHIALALMACLYLIATYNEAQKPPLVTQEQKACMLAYPSAQDTTCLEGLYPVPEEITERILLLADYRLSAFAESSAFCAAGTGDRVFDLQDTSQWRIANMLPLAAGSPGTWIVGIDPQLDYQQPLAARVSDYAYLYVEMAVSPDINPTDVQIFCGLNGVQGFSEDQSIKIPVIPDGAMHEYFFALDDLGLPASTRLTDIRLDPVGNGSTDGESWVQIEDFRLLGSTEIERCS